MVKNLLPMQEKQVGPLGQEDPMEEEMATCSSILAWKTPWTEESGRLQSMGSKELDTTERLITRGLRVSRVFPCASTLSFQSLQESLF